MAAVNMPIATEYGGFFRRAGAKLFDFWLVGLLNIAFQAVWREHLTRGSFDMIMAVVQTMFQVAYNSAFLEKFGATPGKMLFGLVVVDAGGQPIGGMKAWARSMAEFLSLGLLYVGYLVAASDIEKRTLHDRICGTRVIRKKWFKKRA